MPWAGTGVRAATVHGSEGPLLGLYLRSVSLFCRHVPGASRLSKTPGPQIHTVIAGARTVPRKARKAGRWDVPALVFVKGRES